MGNPTYVSNPWTVGAGSLVPQYNRNRVTQWPRAGGTNQYNYHADGSGNARNTGSPKNTFLRWSPDGRRDSVTVGNGGTRERVLVYEYNAFGELVRRSLGTGAGSATVDQHFVWDRGNLLAELDGALAARRSEYAHYPGLDHPFALVTGATAVTATRFVQVDAQGTVLGLTDAAGGVAAEGLETDAWGRLLGGGGAVGDTLRLKWKGLVWEGDSTQLYYVRARWYDPVTRRFVSEDPIGLEGGINPYVYGENDPVNLADRTGTKTVCSFSYTEEPVYRGLHVTIEVKYYWRCNNIPDNARGGGFSRGADGMGDGGGGRAIGAIGPRFGSSADYEANRRCLYNAGNFLLTAATDVTFFTGAALAVKAARGLSAATKLSRVGRLYSHDFLSTYQEQRWVRETWTKTSERATTHDRRRSNLDDRRLVANAREDWHRCSIR